MTHRKLENYLYGVKADGLQTDKTVYIGVTTGKTPDLHVAGDLYVGGTITSTAEVIGAETISSTSANAFAVGQSGRTNPAFNVDTLTVGAVTGVDIVAAAAGSGVAVKVISSATNESGTIDAKGSGTLGINTASTTAGTVTIGNSTAQNGVSVNGPANIANSSTNNGLQITQTGTTSNSTSTGGAINLNNTGNKGAGLVIFSNQSAPTGHLLAVRADNSTFNQSLFYGTYSGTGNALNFNNTGTGSSNGALNVGSTNPAESTIKINGVETAKGTIKLTHTGSGTDSSASGISIDLAGAGTAAQGLYVDSSGNTTGNLLRLRNNNIDKFVIGSDGTPTFAGPNTTGSGSASLGANSPATTNTAPYTWLTAKAADGSTVYIPAWK